MDVLIEMAVAICSGALGVVLFRLLKPKNVSKENQAVIVKVEDKQKENDKLAADILGELMKVAETNKELEKEKNKEVTNKEVDDFFNNRNKH